MTQAQEKYFAHWLTRSLPSDSIGKLTASLQDAQVDLTPHQIDAALFAFKSPLSKGAILADEVGLGKTIEAGIILSQFWAEHRRHLLIIAPANLRKQWAAELQEKFFLPSRILESKTFNDYIEAGNLNPFNCDEIVICSYQFARTKAPYLKQTPWDLVVIDEAHRLRNVYKPANKISNTIKNALADRKKILLTATPLQNSILELYGLTTIIDDYAFGDLKSFKMQYNKTLDDTDYENLRRRLAPLCKRTLRRQVLEYVRYTKRVAILQEFYPTKQEQELYDLVSEYLQRPCLYALPNSQRQLMTLILRKLLASSTHAIYGTLCALLDKLETKLRQLDVAPDADLFADDYEGYDSDTEEWLDDEEDEAILENDEILTPHDIECIKQEIADIEKFRDLAYKIKRNSKAEQLFEGLNQGFAQLQELGAPKKALIFTESRRTQDFLFELLEKRGYKGQVVLFNGSNSDKKSAAIYKAWKERHKGTPKITGSATADKRAALVDYFRNEATIMIATEAAAEGINLQFCSLVVNYDMPWNPQRIEQRIGRCHRYGQNFDVVVINFLNKANAADVRVYELLDQKFQLFSGVFGASDEVLGAIGNGVDFEKRIALIYQQCRTPKEIQEAFDALQEDLQEQISDKMLKARSTLLENFDEAVKQKLRTDLKTAQDNLDQFEETLWQLTQSYFADCADFNEAEHAFTVHPLIDKGAISWQRRFPGKYRMISRNQRRTAQLPDGVKPYRIGDPLAQFMLTGLTNSEIQVSEVVLDYTHTPIKVTLIEQLIGRSGWLTVEQLTIESFEKEDILLHACVTDEGEPVPPDIAEYMLRLRGEDSLTTPELPDNIAALLDDAITAQRADITTANAERNTTFFEEEMEKLDNWAEDVKAGLERELRDLDAEIKLRKSESKKISRLEEKVRLQRLIKELEKRRSEKRLNLYQAQDEVDAKKETLLAKVEAMLAQKIAQKKLITFHWRIV
ncbi:SNF2-related protein [uncultured Alistipes sp.]|uniref:SNF2-related protein n=1 Tax=uncultured Alistipes sp. TaxID=538949 RepID=UPI00272F5D05|nr:SNF2-related protein [uncultured Alistipes sp.]